MSEAWVVTLSRHCYNAGLQQIPSLYMQLHAESQALPTFSLQELLKFRRFLLNMTVELSYRQMPYVLLVTNLPFCHSRSKQLLSR